MPPKKAGKEKPAEVLPQDDTGIFKNDVNFTFSIEVQINPEIENKVIMFQWIDQQGQVKNNFTPLLDQFEKVDEELIENQRVEDNFCQAICNQELELWVADIDSKQIIQKIQIDFSSLLTQTSQEPFIKYEDSKMKVMEIEYFKFQVRGDKPLLQELYKHYLNPMEVEIIGAKNLPFSISNRQPVYVQYKFFDFYEKPVKTSGMLYNSKIKWGHKHVFLLGLLNQEKLIEQIKTNQLQLELHDMDMEISHEQREELYLIDVKKIILEENQEQEEEQEVQGKNNKQKQDNKNAKKQGKKENPKKDNKKNNNNQDFSQIEFIQQENNKQIESNNFGFSQFKLEDVLKSTNQKKLKIIAPVVPKNHFTQELQRQNLELNTTAKQAEQGTSPFLNYFESDCFLVIGVKLDYQLNTFSKEKIQQNSEGENELMNKTIQNKNEERVFERMVVVTEYTSGDFIPKMQDFFFKTNKIVFNLLKGGERAISTKKLTEDEEKSKTLDYLSGFCFIGNKFRVYVFEGLGKKAINRFYNVIKIADPNSQKLAIFRNKDILFRDRIYTEFGIDIKRFKLQQENQIEDLLIKPDLYIRGRLPECIRQTLTNIQEIRKSKNLHHIAEFDLFPKPEGLIQIERRFCSYDLTQIDLKGYQPKDNLYSGTRAVVKMKRFANSLDNQIQNKMDIGVDKIGEQEGQKTDRALNSKHEISQQQQRISMPNLNTAKFTIVPKTKKFGESYNMQLRGRYEPKEGTTYYGCQKNNVHQVQVDELRERVRNDKKYFYTYSMDYLSASIDPYDMDDLKKMEKQKLQDILKSKPSFDPIGKKSFQDRRRPNNLPQSMVEWVRDNPYLEEQQNRKKFQILKKNHVFNDKGEQFITTVPNVDIFSMPEKDPILDAKEAERIRQERIQKEKDLFKSKLVVKNTSMLFPQGPKNVVNQVDRFRDILQDNPQKKGLYLTKKRLEQFKDQKINRKVPNLPVSIFNDEKYNDHKLRIFERNPNPDKIVSQYDFTTLGASFSQSQVFKPYKKTDVYN